jgi:hypothetical protein
MKTSKIIRVLQFSFDICVMKMKNATEDQAQPANFMKIDLSFDHLVSVIARQVSAGGSVA